MLGVYVKPAEHSYIRGAWLWMPVLVEHTYFNCVWDKSYRV